MTLEPTAENVVRVWGHCVALALWCAELGLLEHRESIDRRTDMALATANESIPYSELLMLLSEQRQYLRELLERAGHDPGHAIVRLRRGVSGT